MRTAHELIDELTTKTAYLVHQCYEVGKKTPIYILTSAEDVCLVFNVKDEGYTCLQYPMKEISYVLITPAISFGFEARILIEFGSGHTATFRVKKRSQAVEIASQILMLPFNVAEPFLNCWAIHDQTQIKDGAINIDSEFLQSLKKKRFRLALLITIVILTIFIIVGLGLYAGLNF